MSKLRLTKALKEQIVKDAISSRFEAEYNSALKAVATAARKLLVSLSDDNFLKTRIPEDKRVHLKARTYWSFLQDVHVAGVPFATHDVYISGVRFDIVYGVLDDTPYLKDSKLKELSDFRTLVHVIREETTLLQSTIGAYTTVSKLVDDLPWVAQYLPEVATGGRSLIDKTTIDKFNEIYGSLDKKE